MIEISISLTADQVRTDLISGSRTIVIDILRATSVIITALDNGAQWVQPATSIEEARELKKKFPDAILGGERDAVKQAGFDNGNSPFEYSPAKVGGKGVILTTTNGTQALAKSFLAENVLIGAFINLSALTQKLAENDKPVHLLCAGTGGEFSMDDFLFAGAVISKLSALKSLGLDDLGLLAKDLWEDKKGDIHAALINTKHYNTLISRGFIKDLAYCLSLDTHQIVPVLDLATGRLFSSNLSYR